MTAAPAAPAPCRWTPCSPARWGSSPTPLLIALVVALNYFPVVLFSLDMHGSGAVAGAVVFHVFAALMWTAWAHTCFVDPGTPSDGWQREAAAAAAAEAGQVMPVCRRSGLHKPPRSHFDSVTRRLTLNMDHFCPWVVNTVGFYNRKFFLLFLLYANLTLVACEAVLLPQVVEMSTPVHQSSDVH